MAALRRSRRHGKPNSAAATAGVLLLAAALCCSGVVAQRGPKPTVDRSPPTIPQIGASVMVLGKFDWNLDANARSQGRVWNRCLDQLWRAAARTNSNQVNFVPTHHWLPPEGQRGLAAGVGRFCTMSGNGENFCEDFSPAQIIAYREGMTECFAEALRMGLTISVRPHLDDGSPEKVWRNGLNFSPTSSYGGHSYYDIMLAPLADALRSALQQTRAFRESKGYAKPKIYFSLQGEMGATIARYPREYANIVDPLRARLGNEADILFGIGINFTGLSKTATSSAVPFFFGLFGGGGGGDDMPDDPAGIKMLVEDKLGFIGVSAYAPMSGSGFSISELENAAFNIKDHLKDFGIDLTGLINSGALELHYSEFGVGGAGRESGIPAETVQEVATFPFAGVSGNYRTATDPWSVPMLRSYAEEFYTKVAQWLSNPYNKTHRISKLFIWSHASFDILGIYPESTTAEGSYRDRTIEKIIMDHNLKARIANGEWGRTAAPAAPATSGIALPGASGTMSNARLLGSPRTPEVVDANGQPVPMPPNAQAAPAQTGTWQRPPPGGDDESASPAGGPGPRAAAPKPQGEPVAVRRAQAVESPSSSGRSRSSGSSGSVWDALWG